MIVFFYSTSSFLQNTIEEEKIEIRKFENLQNKLKRRRWGLESLKQKRKNTGLDLPLHFSSLHSHLLYQNNFKYLSCEVFCLDTEK